MKLEVFESIKNENIDMVRFILEGVSVEVANALRRTILSEVPCMAIDDVIFLENDTPLFDEIIAHRLGMIPLTSDIQTYNLPSECTCGGSGCTLCQVELTCSVKADLDNTVVKSNVLTSTDPKVVPVNGNIILAKLQKNTSLEFESYARLGLGRDHAKWQPVSTVGFGYYPEVKFNAAKCKQEDLINIKKKIPPGFIKFSGEEGNLKAELNPDYWKLDITDTFTKYFPEGALEIKWLKDKFIFTIEGTGSLPIKTILEKALDVCVAKIEEFEKNLDNKVLFDL